MKRRAAFDRYSHHPWATLLCLCCVWLSSTACETSTGAKSSGNTTKVSDSSQPAKISTANKGQNLGKNDAVTKPPAAGAGSNLRTMFDGPGPAGIAYGGIINTGISGRMSMKKPAGWKRWGIEDAAAPNGDAVCGIEYLPTGGRKMLRSVIKQYLKGFPVRNMQFEDPVNGKLGTGHLKAQVFRIRGDLTRKPGSYQMTKIPFTFYALIPDRKDVCVFGGLKKGADERTRQELIRCVASFELR